MSGLVFGVSGLIFWVSGLIFWVSELILNSGVGTGGRADGRTGGGADGGTDGGLCFSGRHSDFSRSTIACR